MYLKIILKLKQIFCKHDWDFFDNDSDYPNFTFCCKCDKEIWHDEYLKN